MKNTLLVKTKIEEAKAFLIQINSDLKIVDVDFDGNLERLTGELNSIIYDFETRKNTEEELIEKEKQLAEINANLFEYVKITNQRKKEYEEEINNNIKKCDNLQEKINDNTIENEIKANQEKLQKLLDLLKEGNSLDKNTTITKEVKNADQYENVFSSKEAEEEYNKANNISVNQESNEKEEVIENSISAEVNNTSNANKVITKEKVETNESKKELAKKWKKIKKLAIPVGVGIVLVVICKSCSAKDKKATIVEAIPTTSVTELTTESTTEKVENNILTINNIDLNNYDNLVQYASYLKNTYPELNDFSIDTLIDVITLANCTKLENTQIFNSMDELVTTTIDAGEIIALIGSDNIIKKDQNDDIYLTEDELNNIINEINKSMTIRKNNGRYNHMVTLTTKDFVSTKVNNKYDTSKVLELCVNKYKNNDDKKIEYATIANELMAEVHLNFSINPNAPLSEFYTLCGIYSVIGEELENDNSLKFSTIYGNGNNDNLQGDICVEELVKYCDPCNSYNIFFNENEDFAKSLMKPAKTRTLN